MEQAAQFRGKLRFDYGRPGLRGRRESGRVNPRRAVHRQIDPPEVRDRGIDRGRDLRGVVEVGFEHEDVVAFRAHRGETPQEDTHLGSDVWVLTLRRPFGRFGQGTAADQDESRARLFEHGFGQTHSHMA